MLRWPLRMTRILVVDRERSTLRAFQALLGQDGHEAETCHHHGDALERLGRGSSYAAVIVDAGHYPYDGVQLVRAARRAPGAPCVFLMCASEPSARMRLAAPCLVLQKPVDYSLVHAAITSCRSCGHCRRHGACHASGHHE